MSFEGPFNNFQGPPFPDQDHYGVPVIAPFFDDSDTRTAGKVFYRYTDNETLLDNVTSCIDDAYGSGFNARVLFIATWDGVAEYVGSSSVVKSNTASYTDINYSFPKYIIMTI